MVINSDGKRKKRKKENDSLLKGRHMDACENMVSCGNAQKSAEAAQK